MISNLSYIHPNAKIGSNTKVDAFAYIGDDVEVGDNCHIMNNATIHPGTRMGNHCSVFPGAVVGAIPQDLKYKGEHTLLEIGDHCIIRECVTLNRGTAASMATKVGSHNLLMAYVHVAHDCIIGDNNVIANGVNLAGHIEIGDFVIIGGMTAVHQFVRIGDHAMVGGGSLVRKDVPPYVRAAREPLSYVGVNSIGLNRRGFDENQLTAIQSIYRELFIKGKNIQKSIDLIESTMPTSTEKHNILSFIKSSERGLMKGFSGGDE
jgi:UDP-N-acetylglucosamine acyltransferase